MTIKILMIKSVTVIYIYYDAVFVCLFVTKNDLFLKRPVCLFVMFYGFARKFHGFLWFLVGFNGFSR